VPHGSFKDKVGFFYGAGSIAMMLDNGKEMENVVSFQSVMLHYNY